VGLPAVPVIAQVRSGSLGTRGADVEVTLAGGETTLKVQVLSCLLQLDEFSLCQVLEELLRERPWLSGWLAKGQSVTMPETKARARIDQCTQCPSSTPDVVETVVQSQPELDPNHPNHHDPIHHPDYQHAVLPSIATLPKPSLPTVQFAASLFYADEESGCANIEVIRIGTTSLLDGIADNSVVHWETEDGSAKAGHIYHASKGTIVFGPSSTHERFRVELIDNADWDGTLDFFVVLKQEGIQNAELHRYHMKSRVKVIDDDPFPSNRFQKELMNNGLDDIPPAQLVFEYIKIHLRNPAMRLGIKKALVMDFLDNMLFIFLLILKVWMVNRLLMPALDPSLDDDLAAQRPMLLISLSTSFLVPHFFMHYLDYRRNSWKLVGAPLKMLQVNLMKRFMSYTSSVRKGVDEGEVIVVLFKEIPNVVLNVYGSIFPITKDATLLVFILLYQTIGTRMLGLKTGELLPVGINVGILLLFPAVALLTMRTRNDTMTASMSAVKKAEHDCTMYTVDMFNNFNLLADYSNRGQAVKSFEKMVDAFNTIWRNHRGRETNNLFVPKSLSLVLCAAWILIGGLLVCSDEISMGTFLAEWDIINQIGKSWQSIYENLLRLQNSFVELKHIVRLMNYRLEDHEEEAYMSQCDDEGHKIQVALGKGGPNDVVVDQLPIRMVKVTHAFNDEVAIANVNLEFQQGKLHLLAGRRGTGKTTLLKIIGHRTHMVMSRPEQGYMFIPRHARSLHVSETPLFFLGTLYENLTYGVHEGDKDGRIERVVSICKGMNIMPKTLALISTGADARRAHWNEELSRSDAHILNIVRALVANPEILCIHRPTMGLGPNTVPYVLGGLRAFVRLRGVEQNPERFLFRRPRTCIFTTSTEADLEWGDEVHRPFG